MKIKHIFAAVAALGLASCSNDAPEIINNFPKDNIIRVTTNVNNVVASRSTSDYTGDNFALYISPKDIENQFTYKNVWFTKSDSEWLPNYTEELRWLSADTEYEYSAYAPASGTSGTALTDDLLAYDLSTDNIDLIWANGEGKASAIAPTGALNLVFDHKLCQFFIEVEIRNGYYVTSTDNPISAISFINATGKGNFNVKTGELSPDGTEVEITASEGTHTPGSPAADGKYITGGDYMAPGNQSVQVFLAINGYLYTYTHPAYTFEAGKSYTLKIAVGESSVNAKGITVKNWNEGGSSNVSTY